MSVLLEGMPDEELNEEPDYSNTTAETRTPITAGTLTPSKPCTSAMVIWKWLLFSLL